MGNAHVLATSQSCVWRFDTCGNDVSCRKYSSGWLQTVRIRGNLYICSYSARRQHNRFVWVEYDSATSRARVPPWHIIIVSIIAKSLKWTWRDVNRVGIMISVFDGSCDSTMVCDWKWTKGQIFSFRMKRRSFIVMIASSELLGCCPFWMGSTNLETFRRRRLKQLSTI